jgi:K+-sensing histidine kinase KdpD
LWVVAFTAVATLLRWATDGVLETHAPFSFYYVSVVLTALVAPMGSSILAVILGGVCGHFLWVEPRISLEFLNTSQAAQLIVYIFVASLCALAVTAARVLRLFDYIDTPDD